VHTSIWGFLAAFALIQALAFALSWVGLVVRNGETPSS
jgi:hypothetical protein